MSPEPGTGSGQSTRRLPLGIKLLIGCLGIAILGGAGVVALVGIGGFAVKRGFDAVVEQADEQREATSLLDRLEREHPFRPPADENVPPALRRRFHAATAAAWSGISEWAAQARELEARSSARPGRQTNLGDALAAARTAQGVVRSRVVLARALSAERMSLSEFLWTGQALARNGADQLGSSETTSEEARIVLQLATTWGRAEGLSVGSVSRE